MMQAAELETGSLYEIVAMWDEDVRLRGYCNLPVTWETVHRTVSAPEFVLNNAAGFEAGTIEGAACYRWYEAWMALVQPPVSQPVMYGDWNDCAPRYDTTYGFHFHHDAYLNFFHRRALDLAMPFDLYLERESWWISQVISVKRLTALFGEAVLASVVRGMNRAHREYPRKAPDGADTPCDTAQPYVEATGVVPPSLVDFQARQRCQPCPLAQGAHGEGKPDFGTLNWVDRAWRRKEHLAGVKNEIGVHGF
jgi:hypothetical protein